MQNGGLWIFQLIRVIQGVMQAAAFFARHGAFHNQLGYLDQVTHFKQIVGYAEIGIVFVDFDFLGVGNSKKTEIKVSGMTSDQ